MNDVTALPAVVASLLEPLVKPIWESLEAKAAEQWKLWRASSAEQEYRERLISELGRVKVLGKSHEISVDQIFTDVYVMATPPREIPYEDSPRTDDVLERLRARRAAARKKADEFILSETRIYLLGAPGAGKTTLMRHLAIQAARGMFSQLPIYIPLRDLYQSRKGVRDYIDDTLRIGGVPAADLLSTKALETGSLLLLFDGLDEIPKSRQSRGRVLQELLNLTKTYPKCRAIISCRTAATDYSLDSFKYLELAEFDEEQQQQFIAQWFGSDKSNLSSFLASWNSDDNRSLRDLASSPLLLTLVCISYVSAGALPRRRVQLFHEAVQALIVRWDASRNVTRESSFDGLDTLQKEHLLQLIAYRTFVNAEYVFDEERCLEEIRRFLRMLPADQRAKAQVGDDAVRELQANHGIVVERALGLYTFSHLAIHEYLVARYLHESATAQQMMDFLAPKILLDDRWREVLLLLVALKPNASDLIEGLLKSVVPQKSRSPAVSSLLASLESARTTNVPNEQIATAIGLVNAKGGSPRRKVGVREHGPLNSIIGSIETMGKLTRSPALQVRIRYLAFLLENYDVELFDYLKAKSPDSDPLVVLADYLKLVTLITQCLREASTNASRDKYLDQLVL